MTRLDYLNSEAGVRSVAQIIDERFELGLDTFTIVATARGSLPSRAEVLAMMDCTKTDFLGVLAILDAVATVKGRPNISEFFGFDLDVTALVHEDPALGKMHVAFKPWSEEGRMLA